MPIPFFAPRRKEAHHRVSLSPFVFDLLFFQIIGALDGLIVTLIREKGIDFRPISSFASSLPLPLSLLSSFCPLRR